MTNKEQLIDLYQKSSKHSNYQILPHAVSKLVSDSDISIKSRYENERLKFILDHIDIQDKRVLDVGGNTGFFSFEAIDAGAKEVTYIEGNEPHAKFVKLASEVLNYNIIVRNEYLDFESEIDDKPFDIVLLFNVIHHIGDDFGDAKISIENAKINMQKCINYFHDKASIVVLQMGYCWKGDINYLLFENGTKKEMISFIEKAISGKWKIQAIGIAEKVNEQTEYRLPNKQNIERDDKLGEFRNRPIFVLNRI